MSLTRDEARGVALLARLSFSDEQLDALTEQLGQILAYVDQLAEVDTSGVEPMAHAVEQFNVLADDVVEPSLPREQALACAPKHDDSCYRVPAVLGD